jgi:hypothetical protein
VAGRGEPNLVFASGGRAGRWLGPLGERRTPAAWEAWSQILEAKSLIAHNYIDI